MAALPRCAFAQSYTLPLWQAQPYFGCTPGVARQWSEQEADGLAVLRMIKKVNPGQYIISFSGQKAVHELGDFWKLSDNQLKKPVAAEDCKLAIDEAMRDRSNVGHYWLRMVDILRVHAVPETTIRKLERQVVRQIRKGDRSDSFLRTFIGNTVAEPKVQNLLGTLAAKLLWAAIASA